MFCDASATRRVHETALAFLPLGTTHRTQNPGRLALTLTGVQTGAHLGGDDIVRYDDVQARGDSARGLKRVQRASGMIDWDDAFDNTGHVPGAANLPDLWERQAAAYRDARQAAGRLRADLAYGPEARARLDLVAPDGAGKGLVVFVHGGYWRRFDKSCWTHLAQGCVGAGWTVALPSYPLAPDARISEITAAVARAVAFAAGEVAGPIRLAGHSAGGHLVARMMCAGVLPRPLARRLARVVSISGVHDLRPLLETEMNAALRLTPAEAAAESPALCDPLPDIPFTAWVGAQERPEFLRQTRLIEEAWARRGADVSAVFEPGHHHFSVIEALVRPDSALTQEVLR